MIAIRFSVTFLLLIVLSVTQHVHGQDKSLSEHIKRVAIVLDSSTLSSYAPFDLGFGINPEFKVMGIGEQSHGTSEFFKTRISLINSLVKSSGVTKIGLEAPFAEVENLNAYVLEGKGDLPQILKSFRLFNYECKEFVDLAENVKHLNKSLKSPLTFFGIDMQTPFQALQNIAESCNANGNATSDSISKITEYYKLLDNEMYNHMFNKQDFAELSTLSNQIFNTLTKDKAACLQKDIILKSIDSYKQFLMLNNPENDFQAQSTLRDSLMAENVLNALKPGEKMIVLAHNGHVQRTPNTYSKSMGYFLAQKLGTQYQCMAMTTSTGYYTAFTPAAGKVTDKNPIPDAKVGTFEHEFSKIRKSMFFFNTSMVKKQHGSGTLPDKYKLLPFGVTNQPFVSGNLLDDFNYVLHIEKTFGNQSFYLK
ncbi:erythromycin esterase family protein [Dyadobacter chenhuakuii]|uniref:Erythromycin esterase family protein n=1 Tax=Dyadobacter chenhuakuii TaxID=2909339 RepID=A0A9X1QEM6_9BACT|nr:erythromycin esterase family protein [Dyadobacter chenhuakuii]MCF2498992.1 erythromycin esterase family protein [Dyadobacter chenhuakuii]